MRVGAQHTVQQMDYITCSVATAENAVVLSPPSVLPDLMSNLAKNPKPKGKKNTTFYKTTQNSIVTLIKPHPESPAGSRCYVNK
uniref:Kinesin-like protein NACK1 n=1 Tax=Rhizophora mucronata TaxID=61149 RepID=A0A2P2J1P6_RHIMU